MAYMTAERRLYSEWLRLKMIPPGDEVEEPVTYDRYGRPNANKTYFGRNGMPWEEDEVEYLINWYHIAGPEEMAFALERTSKAVMQKAATLGLTKEKGPGKGPRLSSTRL